VEKLMIPQPVISPWRDVAIWRIDLDLFAPLSVVELSAGEVAYCYQLRRHADRIRFAETRRCLRRLLGQWLQVTPQTVAITSNPFGKPGVAEQSAPNAVHFNISHANQIALIGLSAVAEIGLDIEQLNALPQLLEIAKIVFTEDEFNRWHKRESSKDLLLTWVAKEAMLKAIGCGISEHLHHVELIGRELRIAAPLAALAKNLIYMPLNVAEGYVAACARCIPSFRNGNPEIKYVG